MADGKMARRAMKKRSALLSGNKFISTLENAEVLFCVCCVDSILQLKYYMINSFGEKAPVPLFCQKNVVKRYT